MANVIYTIGHTDSYLQYFDEFKDAPGRLLKLGKREDYHGKPYPGGCVFKTYDDATNYLYKHNLEAYSVFGVLADWDKDTEPDEEYHNLLVDSQLVLLRKEAYE